MTTEPGPGHNSGVATKLAGDQLKAYIERIERQIDERKTYSDDIRDIFAEAKGCGFDVKAMRSIIRIRAQDSAKRAEEEMILDTYMNALGLI